MAGFFFACEFAPPQNSFNQKHFFILKMYGDIYCTNIVTFTWYQKDDNEMFYQMIDFKNIYI